MLPAERYSTTLGDRGRLVLPAQIRKSLDLHAGDRLIIFVDGEGEIRIVSARQLAERLRGLFRDIAPGRSLADELIAERRAEALREEDELIAERRAEAEREEA